MTHKTEPLDYQIVYSKSDYAYQVWTPDINGAIIGIGATRDEAAKNSMASLGHTIADLAELIA